MSDTVAVDSTQLVEGGGGGEPSSRFVRFLKGSGWTLTTLFFLVLFTLFKLPEDRIAPYIDGKLQEQLRPLGVRYSSVKSKLKLGFGISYVLESVTIDLPPPGGQYFFDRMTVSPSFLALLTLKAGADIRLDSGKGSVEL